MKNLFRQVPFEIVRTVFEEPDQRKLWIRLSETVLMNLLMLPPILIHILFE